MRLTFAVRKGGLLLLALTLCIGVYKSLSADQEYVIVKEAQAEENALRQNAPVYKRRNGTSMVVLVTYQRSGSSFLGEIFNQNRRAFTWFEPIDGVYSAIYGTQFGYNVPADMWNMATGSERILPGYEVEAIAEVSKHILQCDFRRLPAEVLAHHFVKMFLPEHVKMKPYHDCIDKSALLQCKKCNAGLKKLCPGRFGSNLIKSDNCMRALLPITFPQIAAKWNISRQTVQDATLRRGVITYEKCIAGCKNSALKCVPHLERPCLSASIRAMKPVRFPMESAAVLKELLPDALFVHNLRDPRGLSHSRSHTSESFQALYAKLDKNKIDVVKEATLWCRNAAKHIRIRKGIESRHPLSTKQVIYENFASDPLKEASAVYDFVGKRLPESVITWLGNNTVKTNKKQTSRNSKVTMVKWQGELTVAKMKEIDEYCQDLYDESNHPWAFT